MSYKTLKHGKLKYWIPLNIITKWCSMNCIHSDIHQRPIEQNPSDFVAFPSVSEGKIKLRSNFTLTTSLRSRGVLAYGSKKLNCEN